MGRGRGYLKKGGGGAVWLGPPPSSQGPPMVPSEGGPKLLKRKSSWHRRRRSKTLAVGLKRRRGRRGGGLGVLGVPGAGGGYPPPSSCGVRPFYHLGRGGWAMGPCAVLRSAGAGQWTWHRRPLPRQRRGTAMAVPRCTCQSPQAPRPPGGLTPAPAKGEAAMPGKVLCRRAPDARARPSATEKCRSPGALRPPGSACAASL